MWGNDVYEWLYDNLEDAYTAGEDYIKQKAQEAKDAVMGPVQWIWETLQGDFNADMSAGQIAANAALGLIPVVDQILDCRDLIANCKNIKEDSSNKGAWIALCLTLIGLFPTLGSAAKGILKIFFLFLRKAGGDVARVIRPAMKPVLSFLADPKVQKILGQKQAGEVLTKVADQLKELSSMVTKSKLLGLFDEAADALKGVVNKVKAVAPANVCRMLDDFVETVVEIRGKADEMIGVVLEPVQKLLDDLEKHLKLQIDELNNSHLAPAGNVVVHRLDDSVVAIQPRIIKATNKEKGLFGEIISDNFMENKQFENLLSEDRRVRKMTDKPRGRGIDGIYVRREPPPPLYIVTETKYRTDTGKYIDDDGVAKDSVLSMTKHSGKQMSNRWVEQRLPDELSDDELLELEATGYQKWLIIVDDSGSVVNVTTLDKDANSLERIF
ncbi:hypothetical protein VR7878_01542 [Vibrio ruber DSM 16370]|uniref:Uncharacterized protein n=1 Tax=Vibrio ruber (strain DSM 16370 / JCM 11486 / BCRC 17186 / CECT 7878 / LMG 23124 / VR1) TaxID=1123498 RepID=A0A1R4LHI7_VIBR1|nr:hypothetical protein [Vibrio ruber]SJN56000.1 hypothetical protein VR7878_01542 [Vibrio ruber DSM 16370]